MDRVANATNATMHQTSAEIDQTEMVMETLSTLQEAIKSRRRRFVIHNTRSCERMVRVMKSLSEALGEKDRWKIDLENVTVLVKSLNDNVTTAENCTKEDTKKLVEATSVAIVHTNALLLAQKTDLNHLGELYTVATRPTNKRNSITEYKDFSPSHDLHQKVKSKLFTSLIISPTTDNHS